MRADAGEAARRIAATKARRAAQQLGLIAQTVTRGIANLRRPLARTRLCAGRVCGDLSRPVNRAYSGPPRTIQQGIEANVSSETNTRGGGKGDARPESTPI